MNAFSNEAYRTSLSRSGTHAGCNTQYYSHKFPPSPFGFKPPLFDCYLWGQSSRAGFGIQRGVSPQAWMPGSARSLELRKYSASHHGLAGRCDIAVRGMGYGDADRHCIRLGTAAQRVQDTLERNSIITASDSCGLFNWSLERGIRAVPGTCPDTCSQSSFCCFVSGVRARTSAPCVLHCTLPYRLRFASARCGNWRWQLSYSICNGMFRGLAQVCNNTAGLQLQCADWPELALRI